MDNYLAGQFLLFVGIIISLIAQGYVTSSYNKYKKIQNKKGITGFEVARTILDENGLKDIYVTEVRGNLTDHYDPGRKVIRLSSDIFHGTTIASASVAAHEVGHALQDKENYSFNQSKCFSCTRACDNKEWPLSCSNRFLLSFVSVSKIERHHTTPPLQNPHNSQDPHNRIHTFRKFL